MGQFIQEGDRVMFETVVHVEKATRSVVIGSDPQNLDQLNYLAGKNVEHCNHMAELGTVIAHQDGGVPQLQVSVEKVDAFNLGSLFYFFEFACGVSAYTLGVRVRRERVHARGESVQPARRGGLQEEHVRPPRKAWL